MIEQPQRRWYLVSLGWFWTALVLPVPDKTGAVDSLATCPLPRTESELVSTSAPTKGWKNHHVPSPTFPNHILRVTSPTRTQRHAPETSTTMLSKVSALQIDSARRGNRGHIGDDQVTFETGNQYKHRWQKDPTTGMRRDSRCMEPGRSHRGLSARTYLLGSEAVERSHQGSAGRDRDRHRRPRRCNTIE